MGKPIVEAIRAAGVVGAGGAGLPAHVKADATAQTVLVNGASCEPLLMSDPFLMETQADTLVRGLKIMMDCTGAANGIICLKGKHAGAMNSVREAASRLGEGRISAFELGDFYPAGDEQVMVYEVLGKVVPERGIPLQIGAVVSNVESLCNIAHAMDGAPVTHRYLTVGCEVARPMVVRVPVGTLVSDVLAFAGGPTISDYRVVDGGPMMGRVLADASQSVTKTTSGLLVLPGTHSKWVQAQNHSITSFKTFMTGELFALLAQHSILGKTLDSSAPLDEAAFTQGLERARSSDALSHLLFGMRALSLFNAMNPAQAASYLSGLLIGQELSTMQPAAGTRVALIESPALLQRYTLALQHAGCEAAAFGDEATWAGHQAIYDHLTKTTA